MVPKAEYQMKPHRNSFVLHRGLRLLGHAAIMRVSVLAALFTASVPAFADPILTSWFTEKSGTLARVIQTTTTAPATGTRNTTPVTTWPTTGIANNNNGGLAQTTPVYADVQRIRYDANWVYINSTGLASYTMGPFLNGGTGLFGFWPVAQNFTFKLPLQPGTVPAAKTAHIGGPIGVMVNGVAIYDLGDAFGFVQTTSSPVAGSDSMGQTNATHPWWRDALAVEVVTFDPGFAHQPGVNGQYHYHAEPKALRYQLGDNMQATYSSTNNTYSYTEDTSNLHHSPILGWCYDGFPIYGPYGYTSPLDPNSGVSRMRSGFVLRNGANATTNLTSTGRTTLPKWAAIAEGLATAANYSAQTLSNNDLVLSAATLYGPATNYVNGATTYSLGRYIGDYDFLGDRGQTQGAGGTFDLDQYNGRTCKTPEFPNGTYAYFVTINAAGNPAFPYMLGKQYYGTRTGTAQNVTVPASGVTELFNGGTSIVETWAGKPAVNGANGDVTISWNSVEGGIYRVQASSDLNSWSNVATGVAAPANTVLPAPAAVISQTSIVDSAAAVPTTARRYYKVIRTSP